MALHIEKDETVSGATIRVSGEVDLYSSPELRSAINAAMGRSGSVVAVDLSDVAYMDSSGVATLVEGLRNQQAKESRLVLLKPSNSVMKVLQLSRLDAVFDIRDEL